jgi:N-acetylneuraminate lyase
MTGIYSASITPYKADGTINTAALEKLMRRNLNEGASGFFIGGSSAECFLLTERERCEIFEAACGLKSETNIIAQVGAVGTDEAIRYALFAKGHGAQYIAATPPFYYGFTSKQTAQYYYDISAAVQMPLMIYNFPANTGKPFNLNDPDTQELFSSDAIWGVKHTNLDLFQMERIRRINPRLTIMDGYDETLVAGLALGADGAIGSTFNVLLPLFIKIYNAYNEGRREEALALQAKANDAMEVFCSVGLIAGIKYAASCQGVDAGEPRRPLTPLDEAAKEKVRALLSEVYALNS